VRVGQWAWSYLLRVDDAPDGRQFSNLPCHRAIVPPSLKRCQSGKLLRLVSWCKSYLGGFWVDVRERNDMKNGSWGSAVASMRGRRSLAPLIEELHIPRVGTFIGPAHEVCFPICFIEHRMVEESDISDTTAESQDLDR
jgi:hypothetical protein